MKYLVSPLVLLALLLTWGCSSSDEEIIDMELTPISLTGALADDALPTRGDGPVGGIGSGLAVSLLRADEGIGAASYPATYTGLPHNVTATSSAFNTGLYYQSNRAKKTKLVGIHPQVTSANKAEWTAGTRQVKYTGIDGYTDILCSNFVEGCKNTPISTTMQFEHLLCKFDIKIKATSAAAAAAWGNVTGIELTSGGKADCVVQFPAPNTSTPISSAPSGNAASFTLRKDGAIVSPMKPTTSEQLFANIMLPPMTSALNFKVTTLNDGTFTPTITSRQYTAGNAYSIVLEFTVTGITVGKVSVNGWNPADGGSSTIN